MGTGTAAPYCIRRIGSTRTFGRGWQCRTVLCCTGGNLLKGSREVVRGAALLFHQPRQRLRRDVQGRWSGVCLPAPPSRPSSPPPQGRWPARRSAPIARRWRCGRACTLPSVGRRRRTSRSCRAQTLRIPTTPFKAAVTRGGTQAWARAGGPGADLVELFGKEALLHAFQQLARRRDCEPRAAARRLPLTHAMALSDFDLLLVGQFGVNERVPTPTSHCMMPSHSVL